MHMTPTIFESLGHMLFGCREAIRKKVEAMDIFRIPQRLRTRGDLHVITPNCDSTKYDAMEDEIGI